MGSKIVSLLLFVFTTLIVSTIRPLYSAVIISDLDDTLREVNHFKKWDTVKRFATGFPPFPLMVPLYRELIATGNFEIYIVSNSHSVVTSAKNWLEGQGIAAKEIYQRPLFKDKKNFKLETIKEILSRTLETHEIYLIGDNTSHDEEIYEQIKSLYPNRKVTVLIRDVHAHNLFGQKKEGRFMHESEILPYLKGFTLSAELKTKFYETITFKEWPSSFIFDHIVRRVKNEICNSIPMSAEKKICKNSAELKARVMLNNYLN